MTFAIEFTGETIDGSTLGQTVLVGRLMLGETHENFESCIGFWSPRDYELQWIEGVRRAVRQRRDSCLIVSINDPDVVEVFMWWLLYPVGDIVYLQDALFFPREQHNKFTTADPYSSIPARKTVSAHGYDISEWALPISDLADFLDTRT